MTGKEAVFGGDWTTEKLERVRKYLVAFATIMNKQKFRFAYIDAFAGTGYRTLKQDDGQLLLPEFSEQESENFLAGSASIALQVKPRFTKYIFIEKDEKRFTELQKLKEEFPSLADDITLEKGEANDYLIKLCRGRDWSKNRAVLFLDPFGMQVRWETIVAIADTKAIDLWYLFPLGIGVSRLLKRDGNIDESLKKKLNEIFGEEEWYDVFYKSYLTETFYGTQIKKEKVVDFNMIAQYFVKRLQSIFPGVANNPLPLYNSRNNPLYLLCFACGNEKGAKTAIKIAQDILK